MQSQLMYMLWVGIALGVLLFFQQLQILQFRPANVGLVGEIIQKCSQIPDTTNNTLPMLADILHIPGQLTAFLLLGLCDARYRQCV